MKFIFGVFFGILAVVIVLVLVAGYFGFVPGISSIFGSDKPRDLGVTATSSDYTNITTTDGITRRDLPASTPISQSLSFSGSKPSNINVTEEQATALLNFSPWPYTPVEDCQVRFNADGSAEISGVLLMDKMHDYAFARGYTEDDFNNVLKYVKTYSVIQPKMAFYVKGAASAVNGSISFDVQKLEVGRLSIPVAQINEHKSELLDMYNRAVARTPGFSVKNFSMSDGKMHFEGTVPQTISRVVS